MVTTAAGSTPFGKPEEPAKNPQRREGEPKHSPINDVGSDVTYRLRRAGDQVAAVAGHVKNATKQSVGIVGGVGKRLGSAASQPPKWIADIFRAAEVHSERKPGVQLREDQSIAGNFIGDVNVASGKRLEIITRNLIPDVLRPGKKFKEEELERRTREEKTSFRRRLGAKINTALASAVLITGGTLFPRTQTENFEAAAPTTQAITAPVEPSLVISPPADVNTDSTPDTFAKRVTIAADDVRDATKAGFSVAGNKTVYTLHITPEDFLMISARNGEPNRILNYLVYNAASYHPGDGWNENSNPDVPADETMPLTINRKPIDAFNIVFVANPSYSYKNQPLLQSFVGSGFLGAAINTKESVRISEAFNDVTSLTSVLYHELEENGSSQAVALINGYTDLVKAAKRIDEDFEFGKLKDPLDELNRTFRTYGKSASKVDYLISIYDKFASKITPDSRPEDVKKATKSIVDALIGDARLNIPVEKSR